ncbi:MAG: glycosyltransferase involved in cell wall biosynthesis [Sphingobacteriales bacterium]|jgi:glycosyltransferase involved in cell wall biosynthesis
MLLSVIIPIYNESANIDLLYNRLGSVLNKMENSTYEMVFVNDGSADNSLELIQKFAKTDEKIKFINFSRNFGHQIAVTAGLDHCNGDAIVIIDADLQDPPELILDLMKKYQEGFQVVYAKRKSRKGESYFKKLTAKWFYRILSRITSVEIPVDTGDFRIIDRKIVDVLMKMPEKQKFLRGQISWVGYKQTFVEYERDERHAGETGYTYRKMIQFALDGITSFSNFPLKFATIAGFTVSGIAFLVMIYTLFSRFILEETQPGWTSLMLSVLFIGGIQLIGIGIIGEYISRISDNVRNRPLYIVSDSNMKKNKEANS